MEYTIDITRPPFGKPLRTYYSFMFMDFEEKESKKKYNKWKHYKKEYDKQLKESVIGQKQMQDVIESVKQKFKI